MGIACFKPFFVALLMFFLGCLNSSLKAKSIPIPKAAVGLVKVIKYSNPINRGTILSKVPRHIKPIGISIGSIALLKLGRQNIFSVGEFFNDSFNSVYLFFLMR